MVGVVIISTNADETIRDLIFSYFLSLPFCLAGSTFKQTCEVDTWMEFIRKEIEVPAGVLMYKFSLSSL